MTRATAGLLACTLLATSCVPTAAHSLIAVSRVASGLDRPLYVTTPGDPNRLFIVEQHTGRIRILNLPSLAINTTPFLTVADLASGTEQGLLGLAFHPDYNSNGFFYVDYTNGNGDTRIVRYHVSADPDVADATSATAVLAIAQPQANHNGGWIGFGPDGYLYIGTGDGGAADDSGSGHTSPGGNGQDITNNLLGKLLRIDVNGDDYPGDPNRNYAIPPSNPFVAIAGDDEIWAYGLRNPWRCSFDRLTGDLYIGDVGQNTREEIDVQPAGSAGGVNYGWRLREGTIATPSGGVGGARPVGAIDPIYDYAHGGGTTEGYSITGGYVYRGPITELQGAYFFADYASERVWSLKWDTSPPNAHNGTNYTQFTDQTDELMPSVGSINEIASFGEDASGNLYIVDLGGEIFRLESPPTLGSTDHFMSYTVTANVASPAFESFGPVTLSDRFRSVDYNVAAPLALSLSADKNGEGRHDPDTHLEEYKIRPASGVAAFQRVDSFTVLNQCNTIQISVTKPLSLLVPTATSLAGPVGAPDPMLHSLDHFLCYRAKARSKLPKRMQVDVSDSFQTRRYDLKKITKLCAPAAKSGSPVFLTGSGAGTAKAITPTTVNNPNDHLLCYKATIARHNTPQSGCLPSNPTNPGPTIDPPQSHHAPVIDLYANNQFGPGRLDSKKEVELCIPSVTLPAP